MSTLATAAQLKCTERLLQAALAFTCQTGPWWKQNWVLYLFKFIVMEDEYMPRCWCPRVFAPNKWVTVVGWIILPSEYRATLLRWRMWWISMMFLSFVVWWWKLCLVLVDLLLFILFEGKNTLYNHSFILQLQVRALWMLKSHAGSNFTLLEQAPLTLTSFSFCYPSSCSTWILQQVCSSIVLPVE